MGKEEIVEALVLLVVLSKKLRRFIERRQCRHLDKIDFVLNNFRMRLIFLINSLLEREYADQ